jgi:Protein of unknown function (DUF1800).
MRSFVLAGVICSLIAGKPILASARGKKADKQIQGQDRVLHALNRFTFGPRPGDVAAVQAMGLRSWFEQQLNPASIDDSALDARLAMFPAMKISQADLMARYPTPQKLRQMIRLGAALPADPVEHAIYADDIAWVEAIKAKQAAQAAGGSAMQPGMMQSAGSGMANAEGMQGNAAMGDSMNPNVAEQEEKPYSDADAARGD